MFSWNDGRSCTHIAICLAFVCQSSRASSVMQHHSPPPGKSVSILKKNKKQPRAASCERHLTVLKPLRLFCQHLCCTINLCPALKHLSAVALSRTRATLQTTTPRRRRSICKIQVCLLSSTRHTIVTLSKMDNNYPLQAVNKSRIDANSWNNYKWIVEYLQQIIHDLQLCLITHPIENKQAVNML